MPEKCFYFILKQPEVTQTTDSARLEFLTLVTLYMTPEGGTRILQLSLRTLEMHPDSK